MINDKTLTIKITLERKSNKISLNISNSDMEIIKFQICLGRTPGLGTRFSLNALAKFL